MTLRNIATIAFLIIAVAISGCATTSAKRADIYSARQPEMSLARNIALHTSLTKEDGPLTDIDRSSIKGALKNASDHDLANTIETVGWSGLGVAHFNGFALPSGVSPTTAASLDLFGALFLPGRLPHPALRPQVLAWMPSSMAKNEEAAAESLRAALKEAFKKSLPAGYTYKERVETKHPTFGSAFQVVYMNLEGPGCPSADGLDCRVWIGAQEPFTVDSAPRWSGVSGSAYRWANWLDGSSSQAGIAGVTIGLAEPGKSFRKRSLDLFDEMRHGLFERMSGYLPNWVYLYSPPSKSHPYPAMYNRGNTLHFISPVAKR